MRNVVRLVPVRSRQRMTPEIQRLANSKLRVGFIHSGGPAPGSNRVIATAAKLFNEWSVGCIGFFNGYEFLQSILPDGLKEDKHYITISGADASRFIDQNSSAIYTSRANPGKKIQKLKDLTDLKKTADIEKILDTLNELKIGALVSIGGDDTLKLANFIQQINSKKTASSKRLFKGVVHIPKSIDNDYYGIPWTFGFLTAAEFAGEIIRGYYDDAKATHSYHIVECMGRKAGWFTAAAGISGRATKVIIPEDYKNSQNINFEQLSEELVDLILHREKSGKSYGVICIAEGLAEKLPKEIIKGLPKDRHGNPKLSKAEIGKFLADLLELKYWERTKKDKKFEVGKIGYATRQRKPNLFDALLTSMLGLGAFRLIQNGRYGEMVTVKDAWQIESIPFGELIDSETLKTRNRHIDPQGDFYELLRVTEDWIHAGDFEG